MECHRLGPPLSSAAMTEKEKEVSGVDLLNEVFHGITYNFRNHFDSVPRSCLLLIASHPSSRLIRNGVHRVLHALLARVGFFLELPQFSLEISIF